MTINFISDLHLDKSRPHINDFFVNYLQNLDRDITDLYILGDLFEYWVGDDDPMDGLSEVREMISTTAKRINVWYMHGNRDFLVSKKICKDLNIHLMIDPYIITHNDIKILSYTEIPYVQMIKPIKILEKWFVQKIGKMKCCLKPWKKDYFWQIT